MMEVYSNTLNLWFGEYDMEDFWEFEDADRMLSIEKVEGPAPMIMLINRNRRGPKGPDVEYVYAADMGKFVKRETS